MILTLWSASLEQIRYSMRALESGSPLLPLPLIASLPSLLKTLYTVCFWMCIYYQHVSILVFGSAPHVIDALGGKLCVSAREKTR